MTPPSSALFFAVLDERTISRFRAGRSEALGSRYILTNLLEQFSIDELPCSALRHDGFLTVRAVKPYADAPAPGRAQTPAGRADQTPVTTSRLGSQDRDRSQPAPIKQSISTDGFP